MKQKFTTKIWHYCGKNIVPLPKMQTVIGNIKRIIGTLVSFFGDAYDKFIKWYSAFSNKLTTKAKMILWEIFLGLLLVCVFIVTNKIATLASQNATEGTVTKGTVVTEVYNDTILGKKYSVKVHKTEVQEYDYWLHTDTAYNVGDKIEQQ